MKLIIFAQLLIPTLAIELQICFNEEEMKNWDFKIEEHDRWMWSGNAENECTKTVFHEDGQDPCLNRLNSSRITEWELCREVLGSQRHRVDSSGLIEESLAPCVQTPETGKTTRLVLGDNVYEMATDCRSYKEERKSALIDCKTQSCDRLRSLEPIPSTCNVLNFEAKTARHWHEDISCNNTGQFWGRTRLAHVKGATESYYLMSNVFYEVVDYVNCEQAQIDLVNSQREGAKLNYLLVDNTVSSILLQMETYKKLSYNLFSIDCDPHCSGGGTAFKRPVHSKGTNTTGPKREKRSSRSKVLESLLEDKDVKDLLVRTVEGKGGRVSVTAEGDPTPEEERSNALYNIGVAGVVAGYMAITIMILRATLELAYACASKRK